MSNTFHEWTGQADEPEEPPIDYVTWTGQEPDTDPYTVPVTPVTLSHHTHHDRGVSDSPVTALSQVDSHEMPGQRGVSDTVTGVTATVRACHPLEGLRTGHWLESQTFPEVEYVVPNLIPEGFTLLVGAPTLRVRVS